MTRAIICLALLLATVAAYWGVWKNDFVDVDDHLYVTKAPIVQMGLSAEGVRWAFTTSVAGNYHPLTWLSHMLDCQLFGLRASGHHAVSLVIHCTNSILVLVAMQRLSGAVWKSAFVAAVFALHPLHVESVAWVA